MSTQSIPGLKGMVSQAARRSAASFVRSLDGRFREYVSDAFLQALISWQMDAPCSRHTTETRAEATLLRGDVNEAYHAVCFIFEILLEHRCGARCNGHHVAQAFQAHMDERVRLLRAANGDMSVLGLEESTRQDSWEDLRKAVEGAKEMSGSQVEKVFLLALIQSLSPADMANVLRAYNEDLKPNWQKVLAERS